MASNQPKKYFAFISYKREDEEWAIWFQHEMENYHLPVTLGDRDDLPQEFRPVFRDIDELKAGNLPTQIYNALESSNYLVVICSPRSAESKWVNKEITDFIKIGKDKGIDNVQNIFPFIVEGQPHARNKKEECFPKALRDLPDYKEIVGGNVNEKGGNVKEIGRDRAFVKVLAGMLSDVDFDQLWNRYERDRAEALRIELEKRDKLLIAQSRFVAEKAMNLVEDDSYLARRLAIEVLPSDLETPDRPYTADAEAALRNACNHNSAIFVGHSKPAKAFFSPDGKYIVSTSWDYTIRLWEVSTGKELKHKERNDYVCFATFTPDGNRIVSADWDFCVRIWDLKTDLESVVLETPYVPLSVAVSPNGKQIVSGHQCGLAYLISDSQLKKLDGHSRDVVSVSFSPNGESFATASYDGTIRIWNAATGDEQQKLEAHTPCCFHYISYSPDGKMIASCGWATEGRDYVNNALVHIWDAETGEEVREFVVLRNNANLLSVSFSPDGKNVVLAGEDNWVRVLDIGNGKELKQLKVPSRGRYANPSLFAAYSPGGKEIVCTPANGTVRIWEIESNADHKELSSSFDIHSFAFSPDGQYLVSAYDKNNLCIKVTMPDDNPFSLGLGDVIGIWNIDEYGVVVKELVGHEGFVNSVSYSSDGQFIVSSSLDNTIRIWDAEKGTQLRKIKHVSGNHSSASFCMDGKRIVSVEGNDTIRIIEEENGDELCVKERTRPPYAISLSGKRIASISTEDEEYTILVWETETGEVLKKMDGNTRRILSVAFSLDEKRLVSVSEDGIIRHWSLDTGEEMKKIQCNALMGDLIVFDSTGKLFLTYQEGHACMWNADEGVEIWRGSQDSVVGLAFCPNGKRIGSVLSDKKRIRVIPFPPLQELIDQTRARFKDCPLTTEERKRYYLE